MLWLGLGFGTVSGLGVGVWYNGWTKGWGLVQWLDKGFGFGTVAWL